MTDIAALVERLRDPLTEMLPDRGILLQAADALEACQAEREHWKERSNFIEVLRQELATMQARAEKAEADLAKATVIAKRSLGALAGGKS